MHGHREIRDAVYFCSLYLYGNGYDILFTLCIFLLCILCRWHQLTLHLSAILFCVVFFTWILHTNLDQTLPNKLHGPAHCTIGDTCVCNGHRVVITRQSTPPISQFNSTCNEFTSFWSMFVYMTCTCINNSCLCFIVLFISFVHKSLAWHLIYVYARWRYVVICKC